VKGANLKTIKFVIMCWIMFSMIFSYDLNAEEISRDARKHMVRGQVAMEEAEDIADYQDAVEEFRKATEYAPDLAAAWFNLGVAQDKAEDFEEAIESLERYREAAPNAPDLEEVESLIYAIEYRQERAFRKIEEAAAEIAGKVEPEIVSIDFPETISANGKNVKGAVWYKDNQGDIVKIRFDVVQASRFSPFRFEPDYVKGKTSGGIGFSIHSDRRQIVTLKVTLIDRQGNRSDSVTFTFEAM